MKIHILKFLKIAFALSFILTLSSCFLSNEARIKISETSLFYILKKGTPKEIVKSRLEWRLIKYSENIQNLCDKSYKGSHDCENVPYIHIRIPIFSLIEGGVHISIYFDQNNKLEYYTAWTSYTFL